jgi:hypothetical protein
MQYLPLGTALERSLLAWLVLGLAGWKKKRKKATDRKILSPS